LVKKSKKKSCSRCGNEKAITSFYSSVSPLFFDKLVPFCKPCIKEMMNAEDIDSVYSTLRSIDKPFLKDLWNKALMSTNDSRGEYFRMLNSLHQYRNLTWENSIFYDDHEKAKKNKATSTSNNISDIENIDEVETEYGQIKVTKELVSKWGDYSNRDIIEMEKLYQEMLFSNAIDTPQHKKQLYFYCKLTILMDKALSDGDFAGYEKLARQFDTLTKSSGFRPIDRKSSDEASGIRSFSQIFQEVEQNGFIEPYNVEENQDIVDKTILYLLNYTRKLLNLEKLSVPPTDTPKVKEDVVNE
jgi:hypothetical protein